MRYCNHLLNWFSVPTPFVLRLMDCVSHLSPVSCHPCWAPATDNDVSLIRPMFCVQSFIVTPCWCNRSLNLLTSSSHCCATVAAKRCLCLGWRAPPLPPPRIPVTAHNTVGVMLRKFRDCPPQYPLLYLPGAYTGLLDEFFWVSHSSVELTKMLEFLFLLLVSVTWLGIVT